MVNTDFSHYNGVQLSDIKGRVMYKYQYQLSNGQWATIAFERLCDDGFLLYDKYDMTYNVMFSICDDQQMFEQEVKNPTEDFDIIKTGKCGLEGLVWACKMIKWFIDNKLKKDETLAVVGFDQRGRVYKYLNRYGFYLLDSHNSVVYGMRRTYCYYKTSDAALDH